MRPVLILFAKAPVPGRVKTRLAVHVGAEKAAALHRAFALDTLGVLRQAAGLAGARVEIHTDTPTDAWDGLEVPVRLQAAGDLGARMLAALDAALAAGDAPACIVGSDAPALPAAHLVDLLSRDAEAALGPAEDGGYYAISCRRTHPRMFHGVRWSHGETLLDTEAAMRACGLTTERGPAWRDIDDWEDVVRLQADGQAAHHTHLALQRLLA
ncbi:MAG: TIGR04282 family arsenosugar biosynthesis glycosyltransferase [Bryobacterales bacterium]|nr:TIGR04282 family arsenosugar biosynthesis glycosyltransferase [Bryobacterales bacterium]